MTSRVEYPAGIGSGSAKEPMEPDDQHRVRPLWRISLFGALSVKTDGPVVDRFEHRKAAALLACLAFTPQRIRSREELMEMLWPEEDPEATRVRFRQTLLNLRRTLDATGNPSEELLLSDRTFVRLNPDQISTDVAEFETTLAMAARQNSASGRAETLQRAVRLVSGALLPGFYEEWVENERRRLTELHLTALCRLTSALTEIDDAEGALEATRKALAIDPLREEAHCDLMRLLAEMGRTAESLRQYQELEQRLWKDLRVTPSPETKALMEEIRSGGLRAVVRPAVMQSRAAEAERTEARPAETPIAESPKPTESGESVLPASLTPLFGREAEIAWLTERLRPHAAGERRVTRLVTLTGLGGSGKTRLALEIARLLLPLYEGALWFVPVAEVTEAEAMMRALAEAVCGRGAGRAALLERLRRRPTLLVIDNFEQIEVEGATTIRSLLEQAPEVTCLITSRKPLHIEGELDFAVAPLPRPTRSDSTETLLQCPSAQLFLDRAQHVLPGFRLTEANREATATLCEHLEGMPLALELAAAWCAVLSPAQILERYNQDFAILTSSRPDIPRRHQSLSVVIESSVQALPPALRELFLRLSVFQGGWTLVAAEAICEDREALPHLAALRRCSLILAEEREEVMRFRMLETLRAYARQQLDPEAMAILRTRHARFFTEMAEQAAAHLNGPDQIEWLARIQADYENLRAALAWTLQEPSLQELTLRLCIALTSFWNVRRFHAEARAWIDHAPDWSRGAPPHLQALALERAGFLAANVDKSAHAREMLYRAVALYREMGDTLGTARCLCTVGSAERDQGELGKARAAAEEALPVLLASNDLFQVGRMLACLAMIEQEEQRYAEAEASMERAAAIYRIQGHKKGTAWALCILGSITRHRSLAVARARFEEGLAMARVLEDHELIIHALYSLGSIAEEEGDLPWALQRLGETTAAAQMAGIPLLDASLAVWQGDLAVELGDAPSARRFYGQALQISRRADHPLYIAGTLRCVARFLAEQGQPIPALYLLAATDTLGDFALDTPKFHRDRTRLELAKLRETVGESGYAMEWTIGQAMSLPQAIDYAANLLAASPE